MKKIILVILLIATVVCACAATTAIGQTAEEKICEIAKSNDKILEAKCIVYQRSCLVAIKTEKFVTRSEYDRYLDSVRQQVKTQLEIDNVYVTRNPKVMQKIAELEKLDENKRQQAIQEIIEHELNKGLPPIKDIMPRCFNWL